MTHGVKGQGDQDMHKEQAIVLTVWPSLSSKPKGFSHHISKVKVAWTPPLWTSEKPGES